MTFFFCPSVYSGGLRSILGTSHVFKAVNITPCSLAPAPAPLCSRHSCTGPLTGDAHEPRLTAARQASSSAFCGEGRAVPCQLAAATAAQQTCNSCLLQPSLLRQSCRRLAGFETLPLFHRGLKLAQEFTALFDSGEEVGREATLPSLPLERGARRAETP